MKKSVLATFSAGLALLLITSSASAAIPVAVMSEPGDRLAHIAIDHDVRLRDLLDANPGIPNPHALQPGTWVNLPPGAILPDYPVFGISAPSEFELKYLLGDSFSNIPPELQEPTRYRIMGRIFYLDEWMGVPVVVFATGGNMNNPAIAMTLGMQHFNIKRLCYMGIGGGGHGVNIGDVLISTGVVPHAHGNLAPLLSPSGDVIIGEFWSYFFGVPIISDASTVGQLVLTPDSGFMGKVTQSAAQVQFDVVNQEVADFLTGFFYLPVPAQVYQAAARLGWTSTGPFITSDLYLTQLEDRAAILAGLNGIAAPQYVAVDQEDYGAIHAAVENGITEWVVLRGVSDLARERIPGAGATAGIPWTDRNSTSQPWAWIFDNLGNLGFFSDYNFYVRQPHYVLKQIVSDWGLQ